MNSRNRDKTRATKTAHNDRRKARMGKVQQRLAFGGAF